MSISEMYLSALDEGGLFEDSGHRTRFKELLDCYGQYPFFSKGLCKCMYLSAWDEEHFAVILQVLADLAIGREQDTTDMRIQGDSLAQEQEGGEGGEFYLYLLSNAFLDGKAFVLPEGTELSAECQYIITRAMEAEKRIDLV